uniref:Helicase ATP-binding domain-containing protein n=1 Tax=viral metagenome TaxID=1070528 RepID=A0A6C0LBA0_9ZZZZ
MYLGQKGYSIPKKSITVEQQYFIRQELTIKPFVQGSPAAQTVTFPAYRESANKFYVPRYFGEEHFGLAEESKICPGQTISLSFAGELRDNQKPVVKAYLDHVTKYENNNNSVGGGGLLELPCAYGKTILSLYIISQLSVKTLIIVHKEFLLNQWIERIQQFLPSARVGRIQGQIVDIENKDIVIGMLQSLSMKDYHETTFQCFGLTIIDEVHHISSEVFSCALFKIVTRYMLGLSATMNRKDGTTKVFKMFLGPVVYKGKRDDEHDVTVRAIEYRANDEDFNSITLDFRGNVQYSTMISKLCAYNHRTEFILRVLKDMMLENAEQQIMVLAHNKNILKYIHDAIKTREFATVGYYVGGMKEAALKDSEQKQIIIATYSMAAEALDIKTLTTLIMATPKTDIEQAVGRILREKHSKPIVVDIIDAHDPFQSQWTKRKAFYKKQNYKIITIESTRYTPDISQWKPVETSKKKDQSQGKCLIKIKK